MKRFQRLFSIILVLSILITPISGLFNISIVKAESGTSIEEIVDIVSTEEVTSGEDTSYEKNNLEEVEVVEVQTEIDEVVAEANTKTEEDYTDANYEVLTEKPAVIGDKEGLKELLIYTGTSQGKNGQDWRKHCYPPFYAL